MDNAFKVSVCFSTDSPDMVCRILSVRSVWPQAIVDADRKEKGENMKVYISYLNYVCLNPQGFDTF